MRADGAVTGLERPDFDLRSGRLHIRRQYARGLLAEERDDPLDTRTVFGNPSMDLYELRHFCGWWMVNVLERPESQVALHLGDTDGGVLVRELYGHADQRLAIDAMQSAFASAAATMDPSVVPLPDSTRRTGTS